MILYLLYLYHHIKKFENLFTTICIEHIEDILEVINKYNLTHVYFLTFGASSDFF